MRQRFKINALASSKNYNAQRKAHANFLLVSHNNNQEEILRITSEIHNPRPYTIVFGKIIYLTQAEVESRKGLNIKYT